MGLSENRQASWLTMSVSMWRGRHTTWLTMSVSMWRGRQTTWLTMSVSMWIGWQTSWLTMSVSMWRGRQSSWLTIGVSMWRGRQTTWLTMTVHSPPALSRINEAKMLETLILQTWISSRLAGRPTRPKPWQICHVDPIPDIDSFFKRK